MYRAVTHSSRLAAFFFALDRPVRLSAIRAVACCKSATQSSGARAPMSARTKNSDRSAIFHPTTAAADETSSPYGVGARPSEIAAAMRRPAVSRPVRFAFCSRSS